MTALSALLALLGFVVLVILHELGHFLAAKAVGMRVERFSLFFPPLLLKKKIGETEYAIGAIPAGGYVKISGMNPSEDLPEEVRTRAYHAQPVWKRVVVILAGPAMNFVLALVLLVVFFWQIGPTTGVSTVVDQTQRGFPAAGAIQKGDRLVSVDGHSGTAAQLSRRVQAHHCGGRQVDRCPAATPAKVVIERHGLRMTLRLTPIFDATPGIAKTRLGFSYSNGPRQPYALDKAFSTSIDRFGYITGKTVSLPATLLNAQQRKQIHGIVGSYETTRQTILHDPGDAVGILALISLSLAIVNLFPFLPLDGGHIFWALVEFVRRRPVPYRTMERSGVIGFALVAVLFIIGLSNDVNQLSNGGFGLR